MSDAVQTEPVRGRWWEIPGILGFLGITLILHNAFAHTVSRLYPRFLGPWHSVCLAAADLLAVIALFAALNCWGEWPKGYPKGFTREGAVKGVALGVVAGAVMTAAIRLALLPPWFWRERESGMDLHYQWIHFPWLASVLVFAMGALREEAIWRGYVLETLERRWGSGWALVLSAIGFGLSYVFKGSRSAATIIEVTLNGGLLYGAVYLWRRQLWAPIGMHFATNLVNNIVRAVTAPFFVLHPYHADSMPAVLALLCRNEPFLLALVFVFLTVRSGNWKARPGRTAVVNSE